jgi:hypothetical protein
VTLRQAAIYGITGSRQGHLYRSLALSAWAIALLFATMPTQASATEQRAQAAAQLPRVEVDGYKLQRKDFRFGNFTAWLKRGGEWHIEGPVSHRGLLCGTYEVGARFGVGNPDCTDVQWVSEVRYVTSLNQCNDAGRQHSGTELDDALVERFDAITCAERVIRCTGNCK